MNTSIPAISDKTVARLISEMNEVGYSCLSGYLSEEQIKSAQRFVEAEVVRNNNQYFVYHGYDSIDETILRYIGKSAELNRVLMQMLNESGVKQAIMEYPYVGVRCLKGQSGLRKAYKFHFDAYAITMLVPIVIPTTGKKTGDLLIYPNIRGFRSSAIANVAEKFLLQNRLTTTFLREMITHGFMRPQVIKLVPGNVYFFRGYRSLHAN